MYSTYNSIGRGVLRPLSRPFGQYLGKHVIVVCHQVGEDPDDKSMEVSGSQRAFRGNYQRAGAKGTRGRDRQHRTLSGKGRSVDGGRKAEFGKRNSHSMGRSGLKGADGNVGRGAPRFRGVVRQKARAH